MANSKKKKSKNMILADDSTATSLHTDSRVSISQHDLTLENIYTHYTQYIHIRCRMRTKNQNFFASRPSRNLVFILDTSHRSYGKMMKLPLVSG